MNKSRPRALVPVLPTLRCFISHIVFYGNFASGVGSELRWYHKFALLTRSTKSWKNRERVNLQSEAPRGDN